MIPQKDADKFALCLLKSWDVLVAWEKYLAGKLARTDGLPGAHDMHRL